MKSFLKRFKYGLHSFLLIALASASPLFAQGSYFARWFERVDKTQAEQPHWITPMGFTTPRLEERVRYDQLWQVNSAGVTTDNYGGGKGVELIPLERFGVSFYTPPYFVHHDPKMKDGLGDMAFLFKFRLASRDEENGQYVLTAMLNWSVPTGTHANGSSHAVLTPVLGYGKGFGNISVQGTLGAGLPLAGTNTAGRTFIWHNALQYRIERWKLWPMVEFNSFFYQDGKNDGKKQSFISPVLMMGRFNLAGRTKFSFGGGFQIATTHYHATNHNGILSCRLNF